MDQNFIDEIMNQVFNTTRIRVISEGGDFDTDMKIAEMGIDLLGTCCQHYSINKEGEICFTLNRPLEDEEVEQVKEFFENCWVGDTSFQCFYEKLNNITPN